MKLNTRLIALLVSLTILSIISCKEEVDDQTIAQGAAWKAVNPAPTKRSFLENNLRHKVIVAAIDTGTDYNHPQLVNNLHFDLDEQNRPIGLGYDFIGQDRWPSPYVARTLDFNPNADSQDVTPTKNARENTSRLIKSYPQLSAFLDPLRNVEQEMESGAYHGTHVSGLMVYDEPSIGLISYRVLPINIKYKNGREDKSQDKTSIVFGNILNALSLAVKAGARVINMSLALKSSSPDSLFSFLGNDKKKYNFWMKQVKDFMTANPHVVFVAAAGNESKWVDDKINLQLPCGIGASNLVCVGALDKDGNLAYFSNLVLSQSTFVATKGIDIESTGPIYMCESSFYSQLKNEKNSYPFDNPRMLDYAINGFRNDCMGKSAIRKSTGTSMASPIIARAVAKLIIDNPELSAHQIIKMLVDRSDKIQLGPLLLNKVRYQKPSWSKN